MLLDCSTIRSSLKRIKISTSPGELRLNSDLLALQNELGWKEVEQGQPQSQCGSTNKGASTCLCSPNNRMQVTRDEVDRLRIKLSVCARNDEQIRHDHQRQHDSQAASFHFLMQLPKMYPHSPPVVYRVLRCGNNDNEQHQQQTTTTTVVLEDIKVLTKPPATEAAEKRRAQSISDHPMLAEESRHDAASCQESHGSGNDAIYDRWSPISRLHDLIIWLADLPQTRQKEQSSNFFSRAPAKTVMEGDASKNGNTNKHSFSVLLNNHNKDDKINCYSMYTRQNSTSGEMEGNATNINNQNNNNNPQCKGQTLSSLKHLTPNRFDVGYTTDTAHDFCYGDADMNNLNCRPAIITTTTRQVANDVNMMEYATAVNHSQQHQHHASNISPVGLKSREHENSNNNNMIPRSSPRTTYNRFGYIYGGEPFDASQRSKTVLKNTNGDVVGDNDRWKDIRNDHSSRNTQLWNNDSTSALYSHTVTESSSQYGFVHDEGMMEL